MQSKLKTRESEILRDVLRHPKRHAEALVYLGLSCVCFGGIAVLALIR